MIGSADGRILPRPSRFAVAALSASRATSTRFGLVPRRIGCDRHPV